MAIPLPDAAKQLGIDLSALRRWVRRANVTLMNDPVDHRRRMMRSEDFERLRQERTLMPAHSEESDQQDLEEVVYELLRRIEALEERVADEYITLNNQIVKMFVELTANSQRLTLLEHHLPHSE